MNTTRTTWGRVKFGGGRIHALGFAVVVGLPSAVGAGLSAWALGTIDRPALGVPIISFMLFAPITALIYAFVVDRETMKGAPKNPDDSIENRWYDVAAQKAFNDVLIITGLALLVISLAGFEFDAMWALLGVIVVAMGSFGIRYMLLMRREA